MTDLPEHRVGPIDGAAMRVWSEALRDDNPIHLDRSAAEALGYGPARVNPGPANLAYLVNLALAQVPAEAIERIDATFLGNLLEDDVALASGTRDEGTIAATLRRTGDGAPVVTATIATRR